MEKLKLFYELMKKEETFTLATSSDNFVSMRVVSPVIYDGDILFYTNKKSLKYKQLEKNKNCCVKIAYFTAGATARFLGSTMLPENSEYREIYENKFPNAFDVNFPFNGTNDDFVILRIHNLKGWVYEENTEIPTVYFEMDIDE